MQDCKAPYIHLSRAEFEITAVLADKERNPETAILRRSDDRPVGKGRVAGPKMTPPKRVHGLLNAYQFT